MQYNHVRVALPILLLKGTGRADNILAQRLTIVDD
jgi:hypothetical protein